MISAQWVVSPPTGKAEIGRERKMSVSVEKSVAIVRIRNQKPEKKGRKEKQIAEKSFNRQTKQSREYHLGLPGKFRIERPDPPNCRSQRFL